MKITFKYGRSVKFMALENTVDFICDLNIRINRPIN